MAWKISEDRPIWMQLTEQLTEQIVSGKYKPGGRIPSVRELAADAGVNPNTMQRALAELETQGLLQTNRTAGRTVTEDMEKITMVRTMLAKEQAELFIEKMRTLGFAKQEIMDVIQVRLKDEDGSSAAGSTGCV